MSKLLVHPSKPHDNGRIHAITPQSAGWNYVGFAVHSLVKGQSLAGESGACELCLVPVTGAGRVEASGHDFGVFGGRNSVFDGATHALYVPPHSTWQVVADTELELAICSAPAKGGLPARMIKPDQIGQEVRGEGTNTRYVRNILPESEPAESLLVVEVITPGGHWSSYPSHKHDTLDLPHESYLEETYYHRLKRPGFAMQRVYTDDGSLDETMSVRDRDVVLVPKGYHPVGAPHGQDLYYLNVMAGPVRTWKFRFDKEQDFLRG